MPVIPRRPAIVLAGALGLALLASACASGGAASGGGGAPPADDEQVGTTTSPAASGPTAAGTGNGEETPKPAPVPEILDFEAPLVGGGTLAGAELAGAPVAVWFWAPW